MNLFFIINPRAGTDRVKAIQAAINKGIDEQIHAVTLLYTTHAGHGTVLAGEAVANGAGAVIAVGGDGSVRDVAKGLQGTQAALGILPKGSGNGLARSLGIPLKEEQAIERINLGKLRLIDVGFANEELFLSNAGVGFDALIARAFATSKRRGLKAYSWLVTKHLWQFQSPIWQITVDGKSWQEEAFMINVANGSQLGYNFRIAPHALPDDGWLDLSIVRKFPKVIGGSIAWKAFRGTIHQSPYVKHLRVRTISISNPELQFMQTDGDAHSCGHSIDFRVAEKALKIIC